MIFVTGDGHTDFMEEATGFAVMEEMMNDDSDNEPNFYDKDSFDI